MILNIKQLHRQVLNTNVEGIMPGVQVTKINKLWSLSFSYCTSKGIETIGPFGL